MDITLQLEEEAKIYLYNQLQLYLINSLIIKSLQINPKISLSSKWILTYQIIIGEKVSFRIYNRTSHITTDPTIIQEKYKMMKLHLTEVLYIQKHLVQLHIINHLNKYSNLKHLLLKTTQDSHLSLSMEDHLMNYQVQDIA